MRQRITVFGGSRCGPDSEEYQEALKLGRLIVEAGFDVASGGYAIGMTMQQFKADPNRYLKKIEPSADFYARLQKLIVESVGYVALRGGMGTMTEISLVWNKLVMNVLPPRPLVLLGACWPRAIDCLRQHLVVSDDDMNHLTFAATAEEAVAVLREHARL